MTREELRKEMHCRRGGVISKHEDGNEYAIEFNLLNQPFELPSVSLRNAAKVYHIVNFLEKNLRRVPTFGFVRIFIDVNMFIDKIDKEFQLFACNGELVRTLPETDCGYYRKPDVDNCLEDVRKVMYLVHDMLADHGHEWLTNPAYVSAGEEEYLVPVDQVMQVVGCDNCKLTSNGLTIYIKHPVGADKPANIDTNNIMSFHDAILKIVRENDMLLTPVNDHE
jgi:hypothetical protein